MPLESQKVKLYLLHTCLFQPVCITTEDFFLTPEVVRFLNYYTMMQMNLPAPGKPTIVILFRSLEEMVKMDLCTCNKPECKFNEHTRAMGRMMIDKKLDSITLRETASEAEVFTYEVHPW